VAIGARHVPLDSRLTQNTVNTVTQERPGWRHPSGSLPLMIARACENSAMPRRSHEPLTEDQRGALHDQALAGLRQLQRELETSLARRNAPSPYLTPIHNRDRLNRALALLQRAGEEVPPWLYKHGPVYPGALRSPRAGCPLDAVSLASVLGKILEARDRFDPETDGRPSDPESP
jgi:hypothetical protein